jgi:hypothetical protein
MSKEDVGTPRVFIIRHGTDPILSRRNLHAALFRAPQDDSELIKYYRRDRMVQKRPIYRKDRSSASDRG